MSGGDRPLRAIVSIHDVMPETLEPVGRILDVLAAAGASPVTLLIVPGRDWSDREIDLLRSWESAGCILAGHGWVHEVSERKTLFHQLHGRLLSRMVAEHLSLDRSAARALVRRCRDWFDEQNLTPPELYVPPAWAMGPLSRRDLDDLPFKRYETARGVYVTCENRFFRLPLVGFEADVSVRAALLRPWNRINVAVARARDLPLRVAIHPFDLDLKLGGDIRALLSAVGGWLDYRFSLGLVHFATPARASFVLPSGPGSASRRSSFFCGNSGQNMIRRFLNFSKPEGGFPCSEKSSQGCCSPPFSRRRQRRSPWNS